jgi:hypothetical protein
MTGINTAPTLAACLIVKNEARHLAACLDTVAGFVDEIVVVDTGSTDDTVRIAQRRGARVVRAEWTDDFSAARNAALDVATADWILSVDADERIVAERDQIAPMLELAQVPLLALQITHHLPAGRTYRMWSGKLFRRAGLRWTGAVHERPVLADGTEPEQRRVPPHVLSVEHFGYVDAAANQAKAARNAAIAEAELDRLRAAGGDLEEETRVLLQIARSLDGSGEHAKATDAAARLAAIERGALSESLALQVDDYMIKTHLHVGDFDRVVALAQQLRSRGATPAYCDWLEGKCRLAAGRYAEAHALLAGLTEVVDLVGGQIDPGALAADQALAALGAEGGLPAVPVTDFAPAAGTAPVPAAVAHDEAAAMLNLARSLAGAGRRQEAFDTLTELRDIAVTGSDTALQGSDLMAQMLLEAQEFELSLGLVKEMRAQGADPAYCDWLAAQAWAQLGHFDEAWTLLEPLSDVVDPGGRTLDPDVVAEMRHAAAQLAGVA